MSNLESTTSFLLNNQELIYKNTHSRGEGLYWFLYFKFHFIYFAAIVLRSLESGLQKWQNAADRFVYTRYAPNYYGNTGYYRGYSYRR